MNFRMKSTGWSCCSWEAAAGSPWRGGSLSWSWAVGGSAEALPHGVGRAVWGHGWPAHCGACPCLQGFSLVFALPWETQGQPMVGWLLLNWGLWSRKVRYLWCLLFGVWPSCSALPLWLPDFNKGIWLFVCVLSLLLPSGWLCGAGLWRASLLSLLHAEMWFP